MTHFVGEKVYKLALSLIAIVVFVLMASVSLVRPIDLQAATSPTLSALTDYSVLGGEAVTCTGATTTSGAVGVSPGTSITGFPDPCTAGGGTQSNNASAIAAQAEALSTFSLLDQTCDQTFGAVDLTATFPSGVGPGVYCSTSSFSLTGNLNLTGNGVHIFKTVSTLITSPGSSVTGGDACNVWWRVGSSTTLDTTTSFIGNVLSLNGVNAMNTGATLSGRFLGLSAATVTLDANTITAPVCASSSLTSAGSSSAFCPALPSTIVAPNIITSRRIDADSIFISWGPYSGTNEFIVQYGPTNGNWLYSTNVTGFSTTLNNLSLNQPIWVRVAARNSCTIGVYGVSTLVGGPGLPNTGVDLGNKNTLWVLLGTLSGFVALYITRRAYKSSSK